MAPQSQPTAGIAGAGLIGRMIGVRLAQHGWRVTLLDPDRREGAACCAYTGAGMLAPYCELESAEPDIARWGREALALWPAFLDTLRHPVSLIRTGSLVIAHPHDATELERLRRRVEASGWGDEVMRRVDGPGIRELEPDLGGRFAAGLYFPFEGAIDNRELLAGLAAALEDLRVDWRSQEAAVSVTPGRIRTAAEEYTFDWAIDCRGLGARDAFPDLRGVRGELMILEAPEVTLRRPVRLMHPRYPLYLVPRAGHRFVVGATVVESEVRRPITVRSSLELLSAAYTVHPGFAEAHLIETRADCRPAFPDHLPRVVLEDGLVRINGLYRHGFLLGPLLVQQALEHMGHGAHGSGNQEEVHIVS